MISSEVNSGCTAESLPLHGLEIKIYNLGKLPFVALSNMSRLGETNQHICFMYQVILSCFFKGYFQNRTLVLLPSDSS